MSVVDLLEQTIAVAWRHGYVIRREFIGGMVGGACEFGGKKWIFVDLSVSHLDQLDQVRTALLEDQSFDRAMLHPVLRPKPTEEVEFSNSAG